MYTVEFDFDEAVITLLDDTSDIPDVKFHFTDDGVDIVQVTEIDSIDIYNCVSLSHKMLEELAIAWHSHAGAFRTE